jgi:PAS domain S-box-containing protein
MTDFENLIIKLNKIETKRKSIEERLFTSEARYRQLFETSKDGIIIMNADTGIITDVNKSLCNIFGFRAMDLLNKKITEIAQFKVNIEFKNLFNELLKKGHIKKDCLNFELKNIKKIVVECACNTFFVKKNKVIQCNFRDITKQMKIELEKEEKNKALQEAISQEKLAAKKLFASETRYRTLFEAAQDGILILNEKTGKIEDANPFLCSMIGYTCSELINKKLWEIGSFKDIPASKKIFAELKLKNYIRYDDLPLKTKDGKIAHVEFISNVYAVDNVKVIQCNIRDITDRKKLENEKEILNKEIQSSEIRFRRLFETAQDGILILNAGNGMVEAVNPFLCGILGYSKEELINKLLWEIGPFKDISASKDAFNELTMKNYVRYEHLPLETKRGEPIDVEFVSNVYTVDNEKVIQCNIRDITVRKKLENERETLIKNLKDALASIKQLKGLLPICMYCKKIRNNKGYWEQVEKYITKHSDAEFTHGLCDDCYKKFYPDYYQADTVK